MNVQNDSKPFVSVALYVTLEVPTAKFAIPPFASMKPPSYCTVTSSTSEHASTTVNVGNNISEAHSIPEVVNVRSPGHVNSGPCVSLIVNTCTNVAEVSNPHSQCKASHVLTILVAFCAVCIV